MLADFCNLFNSEVNIEKERKLPTRRMHALLSTPPTNEEIDLLKHIDLEKMYIIFNRELVGDGEFVQRVTRYLREVELRDLEVTNLFDP